MEVDIMSSESEEEQNERNLKRINTKTREERRGEAGVEWKITPIDEYETLLEDRLTEGDKNNRLNAIRRFDEYLLEVIDEDSDHDILGPRDAVRDDVTEFIDDELKPDSSISGSTISGKLSFIKEFYKTLNERDAFAGNPVTVPLKKFNREVDDESDRPYVPDSRIEAFLNWLDTQFARAAWMLAFKYGIRTGELINEDLCCVHIDHPIFYELVEKHDVTLHNKVRHRPDTIFVYGNFNKGDEKNGEKRKAANKRKQDKGSVLPLDSETKTALIDWLLVRPSTSHIEDGPHPLFAIGATDPHRPSPTAFQKRLWANDSYIDSIRCWQRQESLAGEDCPTCGENQLVELNPADAEHPGRRYTCNHCTAVHWRSIFWGPKNSAESYDEFNTTYDTAQVVTYHQGRHSFSSAHNPEKTGLYEGAIPDTVRKVAIRGDSNEANDTEEDVYIEGKYQDFDNDVRQPYINNIWKFGIYDNPIPAVGEGWDE